MMRSTRWSDVALVLVLAFVLLSGCASGPGPAQPASGPAPAVQGSRAPVAGPTSAVRSLRVEVVDRTAGQSLAPTHRAAIEAEIVKRLHTVNPRLIVATRADERVDGILRANIEVFTAGNRALRFWVGFGAGKAHLKFTAQWLDPGTQTARASEEYQRFGAASLRTGGEIEQQMVELVGDYTQEFIAAHLK